jgi:PPOX class probable F420-dependent enzyme
MRASRQTDKHAGAAMPIALPESVKNLLRDKAYGHVITFNVKGKPEITMVWMDVDGDDVLFNTIEGRRKPQNLRRDPRVVISVQDRNYLQAYAVLYGKATEITHEGADAHINKLAQRFLGVDKHQPRNPGETRLIVRIAVDRIGGYAPGWKAWA